MTNREPYIIKSEEQGDEIAVVMRVPKSYYSAYESSLVSLTIVDMLAKKYVEDHGDEVLKLIAPEAIQKAIEQQVAKKLFEDK